MIIKPFDSIDPQHDKYWILEEENMWFLPTCLDLKNKTYSGFWYSTQDSIEGKHYHTGIAHGNVLQGKILITYDNNENLIETSQGFLLPPNTSHSAKLIAVENCFLFFGTVVGDTHYEGSNEKINVESYYEMVKAHYQKNELAFNDLIYQK